MNKFRFLTSLFILISFLTACGTSDGDTSNNSPALDSEAGQTAVAQTVETQLAQNPTEGSSSPTEIPPTPTLVPPTSIPASPTPIPPTAIPPTPIPNMKVFAIVDGFTGFLLGGSQNGVWLSADMTAPYVLDGEEYRLFNSTEYLGIGIGSKAGTIENGPCTRNYTVELDPKPDYVPVLEIAGSWDVLPRTTTRLAPAEVYKDAIQELLIQQGIANPEVEIINILRVDLEGDGVDEVLINAVHMVSGGLLPPVTAGDYSLIVLRKIINGEVVTIPLVLDTYLESKELAYPTIHTIGGVYDLNGDGRLDIFVKGSRWEGQSVSIFDIEGETARLTLSTGCHQ